MSKDDLVKTSRAARSWPTAGIAVATPFLVWFAMGEPPVYAVWRFGPYDIGRQAGPITAGVAAIVAIASVAVLVIRTRRGVADLLSWPISVVLVLAGALGAASWRGLTSSYSGADIGGPLVELVAPLMITGLLVGAVWIAAAGGRASRRQTWLLTVAAVLVAPALYAAMYALSAYDASAGLITANQYREVQIGQTRTAVHETLGREGHDDCAFQDFPPAKPGLLCDYYAEAPPSGEFWFRFCFRSDVLVSKETSSQQPSPTDQTRV